MSLPSAAGLAITNVAGDYKGALRAGRIRGNIFSIPLFRTAQFLGAWQGFRAPDHVSTELLQRFYYPSESRSTNLATEPGRKIRYSQDT